MSPAPRRRPSQELSRGRFRTLFFALLFLACLALRDAPAAAVAAAGVALGLWSVSVARARGRSLCHSFVAADWLLTGLVLALTGGMESWLLVAVPFLVVVHLLPSARAEWPYLVGPCLLGAIVLGIVAPSRGGHRAGGVVGVAALVWGGGGAAARRRRVPRGRRAATRSVDPSTGLYTRSRLGTQLPRALADATERHQPLALVCVRIDHFQDLHDFRGADGSEAVVKVVAHRLKRALGPDDIAYRLAPETLAVALPGRDLRAARKWARATVREIGGQLIEHQRQTVTAGVSSFPPLRDPRELLLEALAALEDAPITASGAPAVAERAVASHAGAGAEDDVAATGELSIAVSQ